MPTDVTSVRRRSGLIDWWMSTIWLILTVRLTPTIISSGSLVEQALAAMVGERKPGALGSASRAREPQNSESTAQKAAGEEGPTAEVPPQAEDVAELLVKASQYRHLLKNLADEHKRTEREEKRLAPNVKGRRAAALLARLWAGQELGLEPCPQKAIAVDLGLGEGDAGKILADLREAGPTGLACVKMVGNLYGRERCYEITEEGQRQLQGWVQAHYVVGDPFVKAIERISADPAKIAKLIKILESEARSRLASG